MAPKLPNYAVSFAARYASPVGGYLSAHSALVRLKELLRDAERMSGYLDVVDPPDQRRAPWFGAEIIAYYSVGYVTCLEWHARSRLIDLLSFNPKSLKSDDVKSLKDSAVIDMVAANVTVAAVIGAGTNVSSFQTYMAIFDRVLEGAGVARGSYDAIKDHPYFNSEPWVAGAEIGDLERLFEFRNKLVHEISPDTLGHPIARVTWSPGDAIRFGKLAVRLVEGLEAAISGGAPRDFPNLLNSDGDPVSRPTILLAALGRLEKQIEAYSKHIIGTNTESDVRWEEAKRLAVDQLEAEYEYIRLAPVLHYRYEDLREPMRVALIQARHTYLTTFLQILRAAWGPLPEADPSIPDGRGPELSPE